MVASVFIGSQNDTFHLNETTCTWTSSTALPSDIVIKIGDFSFFLHKYPLVIASPVLQKRITRCPHNCSDIDLHEIPGGPQSFVLIAKFCYDETIELTSSNVIPLLCSAHFLEMKEDNNTGSLISQAKDFLTNNVLTNWKDSLTALISCEHVLDSAEKLSFVSKCLESVSRRVKLGKLCCPPQWQTRNGDGALLKPCSHWWHHDVSSLSLHLFKRLIGSLHSEGHDPTNISSAVIYYWNKVNLNSAGRLLLEEMVALLPVKKGATPTKTLLTMLSTCLKYGASAACIEILEKRIGAQLDESNLEDLLVPYLQDPHELKCVPSEKNDPAYEINCIQRIIEHFVKENLHGSETTNESEHEHHSTEACVQESAKVAAVAKLVDQYLLKIATDTNLNFKQFMSLASAIPISARALNDDLYHTIVVYLQCHPNISEKKKDQLFLLIDTSKLSPEVWREIDMNEIVPLRAQVRILGNQVHRLQSAVVELLDKRNPRTENNTGILGRHLTWQRLQKLKLHNYEILKKKLKNRVEKAKEVKRSWKLTLCKKMKSIGVGKALAGASEH